MLCLLGLVQRSRCGFDALCCEPHRFEFGQHLDASEVVTGQAGSGAYRYTPKSQSPTTEYEVFVL